MELKNRRWYEWIMIVLGVVGIIGQTIALITPKFGSFSWAQLLVAAFFLWGGTVPRKKRPIAENLASDDDYDPDMKIRTLQRLEEFKKWSEANPEEFKRQLQEMERQVAPSSINPQRHYKAEDDSKPTSNSE
jgi:hypothetical protein